MGVRRVRITKLTSAGSIKASAGVLLWINVSNTTGNGLKVILNNATSGTGSEIMQIGVPGDDSKFLAFPAEFYFSTGIYCGTLEAGLVVTGGYY